MALGSFEACHPYVLAHEGGFVDHPDDPGGATNEGVTQATYDAWRKNSGLPMRSVRELTSEERDVIYRQQYWDAVRGDQLPVGVDYAVYDFAVNSGPGRAARFLQAVVGVTQDGQIGNVTLAAVRAYKGGSINLIAELCQRRMAFLKGLRHWGTFGRGWTRRVMGNEWGIQNHDSGVIDRASAFARPNRVEDISPPPILDDGSGAKGEGVESVSSVIKRAAKNPAAVGAAIASTTPGLMSAAQGDGPFAYAISAAVVIAVAGGVYWLVRGRERDLGA